MAYSDILRQFERRKAQMAKLKTAGWTLERIAKRFNITRQRVGQILNGRS
jgi:DNA-directed RNA polymerase sigma subunit (sigma70/sigma32)